MPASYFVNSDLRLVVSTGSDSVSWAEVTDCQDHTQADPAFNSHFNQIVDMRAVTNFDMTADHVRMLARRMIFCFESKRAFVASTPAAFGMGRMWQAFVELSDHPSQVRVFHDLTSALQWLGLSALPVPVKSEPTEADNSICNDESGRVPRQAPTRVPIVTLKTDCPKSA